MQMLLSYGKFYADLANFKEKQLEKQDWWISWNHSREKMTQTDNLQVPELSGKHTHWSQE